MNLKTSAILTLVICTLAFSLVDLNADDKDFAEVTASGSFAVAVKKEPPKYPRKALREGVEGWVVLNYVVKKDGTTDNIVVMDASIENYFEKNAIDAVSNWIYQPATLEGRPVIEGNKTARTTFIIKNQDRGVTRSFRFKYNRVRRAIDKGDLPTARTSIDELAAYKKRLLAEVFYLDLVESRYWQGMKNDQAALRYVERALVLAKDIAPVDTYVDLLRHAVFYNSAINNYSATLSHYETLLEVGGDLAPEDPLYRVDAKVKQALEGADTFIYKGAISKCNYCRPSIMNWRHALNRNRFSIDQVDGELSEIEVICGIRSVSLVYNPDIAWSVEQEWGECEVQVFGEDGTTFRLIEHPKDN